MEFNINYCYLFTINTLRIYLSSVHLSIDIFLCSLFDEMVAMDKKRVFLALDGVKNWSKAYIMFPIGVQKPGSQYSPAIYTMDIAYKIDIPLYIFDRYITGI